MTRPSAKRKLKIPALLKDVLAATGCKMRADMCGECHECVSRCPASGLFGIDPRRLVTMALLGRDGEIVENPWIWCCTMCARCTATCPMGADIPALVMAARSRAPDIDKPEGVVRTCQMHLDTGNNTGIDPEGWLDTLAWMEEELREVPGFEDFKAPVDNRGARVYLNQNSKEPQSAPYDLWPLWKILYLAGESWTYGSKWWEATNYCMFLGDDQAWEKTIRRQVKEVHDLGCRVLANTE